jgi:hypothetical protein
MLLQVMCRASPEARLGQARPPREPATSLKETALGAVTVKRPVIFALGAVIVIAYSYLFIATSESGVSVGVANMAGLAVVCIGIVAAAVILRRSEPLQ